MFIQKTFYILRIHNAFVDCCAACATVFHHKAAMSFVVYLYEKKKNYICTDMVIGVVLVYLYYLCKFISSPLFIFYFILIYIYALDKKDHELVRCALCYE